MSEENVEIVRRLYDAVARRDVQAVLAMYDPDVELDASQNPFSDLMGGVYHGYEGLRKFWREWFEAWGEYEESYRELVDGGDRVVSIGASRGRGRASGVEVSIKENAVVWTLRDGKIVRAALFGSREEALEAAGLRE